MDMYVERDWQPGWAKPVDVIRHPLSAFRFRAGDRVRVCDGREGRIAMIHVEVGNVSPYGVILDDGDQVWLPEFALTRVELAPIVSG